MAVFGMALDGAAVSNQVETLLYDTHQKVTNLNNSLDGAVKKLNDTTTELLERVNESENQTRQLRSMMEENQVKLDNLEQQLGQLTATVYQQFNLTSGTGYSPASPATAPGTSVVIEPPANSDSMDTVESVEVVETVEQDSTPVTVGGAAPAAAHTAYQEAQKAWLAQDYNGALAKFSDFLVRYPSTDLSGNAQYWQGRCYLKLEQYDAAIASLEKVRLNYADNDSKVSQAMQSQAVALSRLGRNDEAERLLEEVIAKYPGTVVARQAQSDLDKLRGN
jgi:tol-pal system protein YbgF